ncbi:MAG TPA: phosphoribosylglycinamide synthetase C domain-containing protein, partial [Candidatus Thalassarchaeaceae archaeon]|nr:phosphoribosylglycinamide synthetase C domain-containing protein [Candidatus Thalassarchaeaceae archaeon]
GRIIEGWDSAIDEGQVLGFTHLAGATRAESGELISSGGRVLSTTGIAPSLSEALEASYQIIQGINLKGSHYRDDIGFRALR